MLILPPNRPGATKSHELFRCENKNDININLNALSTWRTGRSASLKIKTAPEARSQTETTSIMNIKQLKTL